LAIAVVPSIRRVRLVGLLSRLCRLPEPACMSFPVPVTLIRFFVPEWVLFFGMAIHSHSSVVVHWLRWCVVTTAAALGACPGQPLHLRHAELPRPLAGPVNSAVTRRVLPGQDAATGWAGACR